MALSIVERYFGINHINGSKIMQTLGMAYVGAGSGEEGKELLSGAENIFMTAFGEDHMWTREYRAQLLQMEEEQ
jgi:hypothetical protein